MGKLENDCLVLLTYLAQRPHEKNTFASVSRATGIPISSLYRIINYPELCERPQSNYTGDWALEKYAAKYGFTIRRVRGGVGIAVAKI